MADTERSLVAVGCGACERIIPADRIPDWCSACRSIWRRGAPHALVWLTLASEGASITPRFTVERRGRWTDTHWARVEALLRDTFDVDDV